MATTTIREMTFRLWRRLDNGDITDDSRFTYRELRGYIVSGLAAALKASYFESINADEYRYADDSISVTLKPLAIKKDQNGLKYIDLPVTPISLPGNRNISITDANPVSVWATQYIPVRKEQVFTGSLQEPIPCVVLFYRENRATDDAGTQTRIVFYNDLVEEGQEVTVSVGYSMPSSDDEPLMVPEEYHNRIIADSLRILAPQLAPSDRENNGVPVS